MAELSPLEQFVDSQRLQGYNDKQINNFLQSKGHTPDEISKALTHVIPEEMTSKMQDIASTKKGDIGPPGLPNQPPSGTEKAIALQPETTQRKVGAFSLEYGLPTVAAFALPESLLLQLGSKAKYLQAGTSAVATGLGYLGAKTIEGTDPITETLRGASKAMLFDVAMNTVVPPALRGAGRMLMTETTPGVKKGMSKMAQDTQELLKEKGRSLTIGGMEGVSSEKAKTIEGFLRGSMFSGGRFKQTDQLNADVVESLLQDTLDQIGRFTTDARFGQTMRSIVLGNPDPITGRIKPGGLSAWIAQTKTNFYDMAENYYKDQDLIVDIAPMVEQMKKYKGVPEFEKAFALYDSYLPKTEKEIQILGPSGKPVKKTVTEIETTEIPIEQAILLKREINMAISSARGGEFKALSGQVNRVQDEIKGVLNDFNPDALAAYETAEAFHGTSQALLEQKFVKVMKKKLEDNPTGVISFLEGGKNVNDAMEQLGRLWRLGETGFEGKAAAANIPNFEDAVMKPLRFHILTNAYQDTTGALNSAKLLDSVNKYSETTREALFGPDYKDRVEKIANAAAYLAAMRFPEKVMPKLVESGLIASSALAAANETSGVAGKTLQTLGGLMFASMGLSKAMSNQKTSRRILDGLIAGPTDGRSMQAMFNLTSEGLAEWDRIKGKKSAKFYTVDGYFERKQEEAMQGVPQGFTP
jgi:hypothetical protein